MPSSTFAFLFCTFFLASAAFAVLPELGAHYDPTGATIEFRVWSSAAMRIEARIFAEPFGASERATFVLTRDPSSNVWSTAVATAELAIHGVTATVYYGYRAWGPNWPYEPAWTPGSAAGFTTDVDAAGNRFNPNKLLIDPYALEISHDPHQPLHEDGTVFASGEREGDVYRTKDSAHAAPKGIVLPAIPADPGHRPLHTLRDDVIYEVHVRGLTMSDPTVPAPYRGTYRGAALKAPYLRGLGVTAVEFLPLQETGNDQNDIREGTDWDNYWGYSTLNYFSPDRRYAFDRAPGGPTREFREMVRAFHAHGIKVFVDVVYNHTGEGGLWSGDRTDVINILSWRGLDNAAYYELTKNEAGDYVYFWDNTCGVGNFNVAHRAVRDLVLDSLRYWAGEMGVDGFRFDLASVLANACARDCFRYERDDPDNILNRAARELPARPAAGGAGVDLIAEPWGLGEGTYQVGSFPAGWAEWNDRYRDTIRRDQNKLSVEPVAPGELATRFAGSSDLFEDDGRRPWHSINFLVAHDGFTLLDLYSFNEKNNLQPWPFGPSDGGTDHNLSWDQGGDPAAQVQAARTGLALLFLSAGTPMILGGDEMLRTRQGNNNAYNLDSERNWLDWSHQEKHADFVAFARRLFYFRHAHPAIRRDVFYTGTDHDGNGLKDITWYTDTGAEPDDAYWGSPDRNYLGFRIDGSEAGDPARSIYVGYNGWWEPVTASLPPCAEGRHWYLACDTAAPVAGNDLFAPPGREPFVAADRYELKGRSAIVLVER